MSFSMPKALGRGFPEPIFALLITSNLSLIEEADVYEDLGCFSEFSE